MYICGQVQRNCEYVEQYIIVLPHIDMLYDYANNLTDAKGKAIECAITYANTAVVLHGQTLCSMHKYNENNQTVKEVIC